MTKIPVFYWNDGKANEKLLSFWNGEIASSGTPACESIAWSMLFGCTSAHMWSISNIFLSLLPCSANWERPLWGGIHQQGWCDWLLSEIHPMLPLKQFQNKWLNVLSSMEGNSIYFNSVLKKKSWMIKIWTHPSPTHIYSEEHLLGIYLLEVLKEINANASENSSFLVEGESIWRLMRLRYVSFFLNL